MTAHHLYRLRNHSLAAVILLLGFLVSPYAQAKTVAGVELAPSMSIGEAKAQLIGAGIRKKLFFKLYVASLYSTTTVTSANELLEADAAMAIQLDVISELLTRDKMVAALKEGFQQSTQNNTAPIQSEIDQLIDLMQDKVVPGTVITLAYEPLLGTHVIRDGTLLASIPGIAFKQALFGIWLSNKPVQANLKQAMLGSS